METRVSRLLGTKYPVIQGGMAWVAEYHLAAAVSNAGGTRNHRGGKRAAGSGKRTDP